MNKQPFDHLGRFISKKCPDPHCDGELFYEDGLWICDGLTYESDNEPYRECGYYHHDGYKKVEWK